MNDLAGLYLEQQRCADAEPLYLKTLEIRSRVLGEDHSDTLISMKNLAALGVAQYRASACQSALATLNRVDAFNRITLNLESRPPDVAYLAMTLHQLGRHQEARAALDRLRKLFENDKHDHEPCRSILREAEQLITSGSPMGGENNSPY